MIKVIKSFKLLTGLIFFLISALIVGTWFKGNTLYGGAEVGLFGYNPERWLEISKYIWWDVAAPGQLIPHFITGVPIYFFFYILELIGLSPQNIQQLFFFLMLFLMGYGMFLLAFDILDEDKKKYSLIAAIFYLFNAYTLVSVWHRFLYSTIILAAVLPLLILFWRRWIKEGRIFNLNFFLLVNFLSVYMYGNLASVITVWIAFLLISLAEIFFPWQGKFNAGKLSGRFLAGFIFWLLTNMWWITPTFLIAPGLLPQQHSSEDNLGTLVQLSRQTIMPYLLQLVNPYYLFYRQELGTIYSSFIFRMIPWIISAVILLGLIVSLRLKDYAKYSVIFIILLLLAKGAAPPFAYPLIFGFKHLYILGVLRNPFEKLGILLPVFGAILFIVGLQKFFKWGNKYLGLFITRLVFIFVLIILFGYAWPMVGGRVFGTKQFPVRVKVPDSYIEADEWLKQQKVNQGVINQGVILHLPFSGKDVVTYNWDAGYHGVDQNEILFTSLPSLSRVVGIKRVDDTLNSLTYFFNSPFFEDKRILRILQSFNISYIVLHKDTKWADIATYGKDIRLMDPSEMETNLNSLSFLQREINFGNLVIYKLRNQYYQPKITLFETGNLVYPQEANIMQFLNFFENEGQFITIEPSDLAPPILSKIKDISIFPQNSLRYFIASESALTSMANSMLFQSYGSDPIVRQLHVIKDTFSQTGELDSQDLVKEMILANDSLIRFFSDNTLSNESRLSILDTYQHSQKRIFKSNFKTSNLYTAFKDRLADVFNLHLYLLEQAKRSGSVQQSKISEIQNNLIEGLKVNNLLPNFLQTYLPAEQTINRKILQLKVPLQAKYELVMPYRDVLDAYPEFLSELDLRINNQPLSTQGKIDKNIISFGDFDFDSDTYEISYNLLQSSNLVPPLNQFWKAGQVIEGPETMQLISTNGQIAFLESMIKIVTGGDIYEISFDVLPKQKAELYVELIQNSEMFDAKNQYQSLQPNECIIHNCYLIQLDPGKTDWQRYTFLTPPLNLASQKANIRILGVAGEVLIKNFQVKRFYDENIILRKTPPGVIENSFNNLVTMNYQNPVMYKGGISIDKPTFLFFKETFHPGWTLELTKDSKAQRIDQHYLGNLYGNVWWIDKSGDYDFKIEFIPQRNVNNGVVVAITTGILLLIINCYTYLKELSRK